MPLIELALKSCLIFISQKSCTAFGIVIIQGGINMLQVVQSNLLK